MNFFDILSGTPFWVWIVFAYIIFSGIKSSQKNTVPLWKLSIMPAIFIVWSLYSIYNKCAVCPQLFGIWLLFLVVGILIGYYIARKLNVSINPETRLINVSGSFIPLFLALSFFIIKYILGATYALNPLMKTSILLVSFDLAVSGLISGISLGRFMTVVYHYTCKTFDKRL